MKFEFCRECGNKAYLKNDMTLKFDDAIQLPRVREFYNGSKDGQITVSYANVGGLMVAIKECGINEVSVTPYVMYGLIQIVNSYINQKAERIDNSSQLFKVITEGKLDKFMGVKLILEINKN